MKNSILTILATFCSSLGHNLLLTSMTILFYAQEASEFKSALTMALSWIPATVLIIIGGSWADTKKSKTFWLLAEVTNLFLTFGIIFSFVAKNWILAFTFVLFKGVTEFLIRVLRNSSLAYFAEKKDHSQLIAAYQFSYYLGFAAAGLLGIKLIADYSFLEIGMVSVGGFFVSFLAVTLTKQISSQEPVGGASNKIRIDLLRNQEIRLALTRLLLIAALFQGTFSVFQAIYPIKNLGLAANSGSTAVLISSLGILFGAFIFQFFSKRKINIQKLTFVVVVTALFYALIPFFRDPLAAAVVFFVMIVGFEYAFMVTFVQVASHPGARLGELAAVAHAFGPLSQALVALIVGLLLKVDVSIPFIVWFSMFVFVLIWFATRDRKEFTCEKLS